MERYFIEELLAIIELRKRAMEETIRSTNPVFQEVADMLKKAEDKMIKGE